MNDEERSELGDEGSWLSGTAESPFANEARAQLRTSRGEKIALVVGAAVILVATAYAISQGGVVIVLAGGTKVAIGKAAVVAAAAA